MLFILIIILPNSFYIFIYAKPTSLEYIAICIVIHVLEIESDSYKDKMDDLLLVIIK